jgi:hypothetical protein
MPSGSVASYNRVLNFAAHFGTNQVLRGKAKNSEVADGDVDVINGGSWGLENGEILTFPPMKVVLKD